MFEESGPAGFHGRPLLKFRHNQAMSTRSGEYLEAIEHLPTGASLVLNRPADGDCSKRYVTACFWRCSIGVNRWQGRYRVRRAN